MSSEEADEEARPILPRYIRPEAEDITEESQPRSQASHRSDQASSRISITPTVGSPNESPERLPAGHQIRLPRHREDLLRFPSISVKNAGSESLLLSEAVSSVPRRHDGGDSSYAITPKDSESSFVSGSFSQAVDDPEGLKLKKRLSIPAKEDKINPEALESNRALGKNEEYLRDFATFHVMFSDEEIQGTFEEVDYNSNGYITTEEIRMALEGIGEYASDEEIAEMVRMVDIEGRGEVAFEEFYKMATGQSTAPIGGALPPSPLMTIVGVSDRPKTWGLQNRSFRSTDRVNVAQAAAIDSKVDKQLSKAEISAQQSSQMPEKTPMRPLKSFETVSKPKKKPKVFNLAEIRKAALTKSSHPPEPSQPLVPAIPLPFLSASRYSRHSPSQPLSNRSTEQSRSPLVSELLNSTIFTAEVIEKLIKLFSKVTGSEGGDLGYNAFLEVVNSRLPGDMRLEDDRVTRRMFTLLDKDKSQGLNVREFLTGLSALCRPTNEEQFRFVYMVFDADGDGTISKNELIRILKLNPVSVQTDEQAQAKAEELLYLSGDDETMTLEGFLKLKDKRLSLLVPVQERARKMAYIVNCLDSL
jgi:Ca2+-binding EF-hand superfamily protein